MIIEFDVHANDSKAHLRTLAYTKPSAINGYFKDFSHCTVYTAGRGWVNKSAMSQRNLADHVANCADIEQLLNSVSGPVNIIRFDKRTRTLYAARDKKGFTALYYRRIDGKYFFSHDQYALAELRPRAPVNTTQLKRYTLLHYSTVWGAASFFEDIHPIAPGHFLVVTQDGLQQKIYWDWPLSEIDEDDVSEEKVTRRLDEEIRRAVQSTLPDLSDSSAALALSGGLDSTAVLAYFIESGIQLKSFTARYSVNAPVEESLLASSVADHFKSPWDPIDVRPSEAISLLKDIYNFHSVPLASSSILGYHYIFKRMKEKGHSKIVLGGSADNLLNGNHIDFLFRLSDLYFNKAKNFDLELELWITKFNTLQYPKERSTFFDFYSKNINEDQTHISLRDVYIAEKYLKEGVIEDDNKNNQKVIWQKKLGSFLRSYTAIAHRHSAVQPMIDGMNSIADVLGVEFYDPYLDPNLEEYCLTIPEQYKINKATNKYILRRLMQTRLPGNIINRQVKVGFDLPFGDWLKTREYRMFVIDRLNDARDTIISNWINIDDIILDITHNTTKLPPMFIWQVINAQLWLEKRG